MSNSVISNMRRVLKYLMIAVLFLNISYAYMSDGEPTGIGSDTTLQQIRDIVQKQADGCQSKEFTSIVDTAEIQTQAGHYKKALEAYRKAYAICPMKDLEEQMAWLMGEVGDE